MARRLERSGIHSRCAWALSWGLPTKSACAAEQEARPRRTRASIAESHKQSNSLTHQFRPACSCLVQEKSGFTGCLCIPSQRLELSIRGSPERLRSCPGTQPRRGRMPACSRHRACAESSGQVTDGPRSAHSFMCNKSARLAHGNATSV